MALSTTRQGPAHKFFICFTTLSYICNIVANIFLPNKAIITDEWNAKEPLKIVGQWICILMLLFAFDVHAAWGQTTPCVLTLSGSVADADEKAPLDKAVILIKEIERSTETDTEGHYHFYNLCPGTYTFLITHADCDTISLRVKIEANLVKNFSLPHHYNQLSAVQVVSAQRSQEIAIGEEVGEVKGFDLGLMASGGYHSKKGVVLSVSYLKGLTQLQNAPNFDWQNNVIGLTIGYMLPTRSKK